jgi:UDP-3-O-acyl-N-acetylglucosamine deacetylase
MRSSRTIGHLYAALESLGIDEVAVMAVTHIPSITPAAR